MKILVILASPDADSFNAAICDTYAANIDRTRNEVKTLKLGELDFDPVLRFGYREKMPADPDVTTSQELLTWADRVVFIYPIWWSSMPGLLKGWIDRVLTPGYAYNLEGVKHVGHLAGRTAELWMTSNGPGFYYRWLSPLPVRLMCYHILRLCGIPVRGVHIFGNAEACAPAKRSAWLKRVAKAAAKL
ncbi:MAG: NAD(P)H-dependent oxidoreductase [Propionibacteriaceae bacterium]|jgi:putative NADPH-quinone reductase|nr:NAD(P)H-dependent oxidoreductase [Propionibacteriaceae bacterium]